MKPLFGGRFAIRRTPPPPLVSVALVTYNQAPFIREAVQSVLDQTLADLEVIIVDDGSTDGTGAAVAEFHDPRVYYIRQENRGPNRATNLAVSRCRGEFIALSTGDDVSEPTRLEAQLAVHRAAGAGAVFTNVSYIDATGAHLENSSWPKDFFRIPAMTRGEILCKFFFNCNFIHTCTTFAHRDLFNQVGPMDPMLYQLADFDHLIRLVARTEFAFLPEKLVRWRFHPNNGNLSSPSPEHAMRTRNERYIILRRFFDGVPDWLIVEAFLERFRNRHSRSPDELACETAFLYTLPEMPEFARPIGFERLYGMLNNAKFSRILADKFRFGEREFVDLMAQADHPGSETGNP